jgi:sigma-B regulation protein RsbU (phosphoserine phosphatase)
MKVLVIEDQPVSAMQIAGALRALGHEPVRVDTGNAAWSELAGGHYRVVVSDWRMPGLDGLDLCRMVRERAGEYIYFILVSAADMTDANRDEALAAGVDEFLPKPVNPQDLKMRLHVAERILKFTAQVKQLESFLPICGYCKKIRDDKNYWNEVEDYLSSRDGTRFSHGVCPACWDREMVPQLKKLGIDPPPAA